MLLSHSVASNLWNPTDNSFTVHIYMNHIYGAASDTKYSFKWEYLPAGLSWTLDPFAETINLGGGAKENKRLDEKSLEHKKARWL